MNLMPCQDSHLPRQSLVGKTSWRIHHELFQGKDGSQNGWVGGSLLSPSQRGYQTKNAFEARTFLEGHTAKALGRFCFLYGFFSREISLRFLLRGQATLDLFGLKYDLAGCRFCASWDKGFLVGLPDAIQSNCRIRSAGTKLSWMLLFLRGLRYIQRFWSGFVGKLQMLCFCFRYLKRIREKKVESMCHKQCHQYVEKNVKKYFSTDAKRYVKKTRQKKIHQTV